MLAARPRDSFPTVLASNALPPPPQWVIIPTHAMNRFTRSTRRRKGSTRMTGDRTASLSFPLRPSRSPEKETSRGTEIQRTARGTEGARTDAPLFLSFIPLFLCTQPSFSGPGSATKARVTRWVCRDPKTAVGPGGCRSPGPTAVTSCVPSSVRTARRTPAPGRRRTPLPGPRGSRTAWRRRARRRAWRGSRSPWCARPA